jgi:hypothetical protein
MAPNENGTDANRVDANEEVSCRQGRLSISPNEEKRRTYHVSDDLRTGARVPLRTSAVKLVSITERA